MDTNYNAYLTYIVFIKIEVKHVYFFAKVNQCNICLFFLQKLTNVKYVALINCIKQYSGAVFRKFIVIVAILFYCHAITIDMCYLIKLL